MAGTNGLKKEKYHIAQAVGQPLFNLIEHVAPELVLCDTETCRWQIRHATGLPVHHPITMVHRAYSLSDVRGRESDPRRPASNREG